MEKDNLIPELDDDFELIVDITEDDVKEPEEDKEPLEEPEVETEPEVVVDESTEDEVQEDVDDTAKAVYATLVEKGILPEDKDFNGSWDKLEESLTSLPERVANDIVESAPDITKKVLEFAFASGENITKESMKTFMETYLSDIENAEKDVDVTTVEGARAFMKAELSKTLKPVAVEAALDAMEDDDSLIDEAKAKLEAVKKSNNHQKLIDDVNAQNAQNAERIKQRSIAIQKELTTDNYSKEALNVMVNYLKNNELNTILKEVFENPKALVQLTHFATKFDRDSKQFKFDDFVKEVATPVVEKTKRNILKDSFSSLPKTTTKSEVSQNNKYKDAEPLLEF